MKKRMSACLAAGVLTLGWTCNSLAVQTWLALRQGCPMNVGTLSTTQLIGTNFGATAAALPFANTATYDFYSPPLESAVSLVPSDKGGGMIYMRNTSTDSSHDFAVTGRMQFLDYDPASGTETLIVDTTASPPKNVNHGQTVNWAIPNAMLPANTTVSAGHIIHIALTIGLVSGTPGSFGQLLYNGGPGPSTSGFLPQNRSTVLAWPFDALPATLAASRLADGSVLLTCTGTPEGSYTVHATTNLLAPVWTTLGTTNADVNGLFTFIDHDAKTYPCRFYRTSTP